MQLVERISAAELALGLLRRLAPNWPASFSNVGQSGGMIAGAFSRLPRCNSAAPASGPPPSATCAIASAGLFELSLLLVGACQSQAAFVGQRPVGEALERGRKQFPASRALPA